MFVDEEVHLRMILTAQNGKHTVAKYTEIIVYKEAYQALVLEGMMYKYWIDASLPSKLPLVYFNPECKVKETYPIRSYDALQCKITYNNSTAVA